MKNRKISKSKIVVLALVCAVVLLAAAAGVFFAVASPEIVLNGDTEITLSTGDEYAEPGASAKFGFIDITDKVARTGEVDTSVPNEFTVKYSVSFFGKTAEKTRIVHVVDTVPPVITLLGEENVSVQTISEFVDAGATASDNYDGDLTSKITVSVIYEKRTDADGVKMTVYEYKYSVTDSSGNTATAVRTVTEKDTVPPEIRLNGADETVVLRGKTYREQGASATDNVTENPEIKISGSVDTSKVGTYKLTYTAYDAGGNTASVTRTVKVREPLSPSQGNADDTSGSVICLTFDDGPNWGTTDKILDILKDYNVKATFFIIDYSADKLPLIKRIINEGHTLAIHSRSHTYSECYKNADAYMNGLYYMQDKIYADTGYTATVIRFPGGTSNTVSRKYCKGVMTELSARAVDAGFNYVDWNVDSTDASGTCRPNSALINNTLGGLRKNRVNVVLMHDASAKKTTPEALPEIISRAAEQGYKFARVSDSTRCRHAVNN